MKIDKQKQKRIKYDQRNDFDLAYSYLSNGASWSDYKSALLDKSLPQERQNKDKITEDDILAAWILGKDERSEQYSFGGHLHDGESSSTAKTGADYGSLISGAAGLVTNAINNANSVDEHKFDAYVNSIYDYNPGFSYDNAYWMNRYNELPQFHNITFDEAGGHNGWQVAGNVLQGIGQGFGTGMATGSIWGGIAGAVIGGVASGIGEGVHNNKARQTVYTTNTLGNIGAQQNRVAMLNNMYQGQRYRMFDQMANEYNNNLVACGGKMKRFDNGGYINSHYDYITDPLVKVNAGGTHQENPNEGVQTSIAPDGQPNLVEEGETIIDNGNEAYVFSDRIIADQEILKSHLLNDKWAGKTYADISKELDKIVAEHETDEVSKRTFDEMISRLQQAQEDQKFQEKQAEVEKFINSLSDEQKEQLEEQMVAEAQAAEEQAVAEQQAAEEAAAQEQAAQEEQMQPEQAPEQVQVEKPIQEVVPSRYDEIMNRAAISEAANNGMFGRGGHLHQLWNSEIKDRTKYKQIFLTDPPQDEFGNFLDFGDYESTVLPNYHITGSSVQTIPFTRSGYDQNENEIFLEDDSPMNRYTASVMRNVSSSNPNLQNANNTVGSVVKDSKVSNPAPETNVKGTTDYSTWLRYAPAIGSGLQVLSDALGLTNKNDYTNADLYQKSINSIPTVNYLPIGNYLSYSPVDETYQQNAMRSAARANARGIVNNAAGNAGAAIAGLNALNFGTTNELGDFGIRVAMYNNQMGQKVAEHNIRVNAINASHSLSAQEKNQAIAAEKARLNYNLAQMRQSISDANDMAKAANYTNLMTNLGNIGRENFAMEMVRTNPAFYYEVDKKGHITYKNGFDNLPDSYKDYVRRSAEYEADNQ